MHTIGHNPKLVQSNSHLYTLSLNRYKISHSLLSVA